MQEVFRQQAYQIIAFHELSFFIAEETTVKVAVPGNAEVRMMLQHRVNRVLTVFFQHGIRHAVGERSVRLVVYLYETERQIVFQFVQHCAGPAVTGVHYNFNRFQFRSVDVFQNMLHIRLQNILPGQKASGFAGHEMMREFIPPYHLFDLLQARIHAHRSRIPPYQLQPVILRRIMTGRDHDPPVRIQVCGGKIYHFRAALTDIDYVGTAILQSVTQGLKQFRAGQADVTAHNHRFRPE